MFCVCVCMRARMCIWNGGCIKRRNRKSIRKRRALTLQLPAEINRFELSLHSLLSNLLMMTNETSKRLRSFNRMMWGKYHENERSAQSKSPKRIKWTWWQSVQVWRDTKYRTIILKHTFSHILTTDSGVCVCLFLSLALQIEKC